MCVRMALARENMTAKELGDCIGVSRQTICNYCTGKTAPNMEKIELIAASINVPCEVFLSWGKRY